MTDETASAARSDLGCQVCLPWWLAWPGPPLLAADRRDATVASRPGHCGALSPGEGQAGGLAPAVGGRPADPSDVR